MIPKNASRIGVGTVQFGIDYGITNNSGMTTPDEVRTILGLAAREGIDTLDTASLYGQSEAVLGQTLTAQHSFHVVTKTPDFSKLSLTTPGAAEIFLREAFHLSLHKLKAASVYGLLVHNAGGMDGSFGQEIYDALRDLKAEGLVRKIGLSVYTLEQAIQVMDKTGPIDIVQVPINLFDQRLLANGGLDRLKAAGVEIHARSLFLQGSLLSGPGELPARLSAWAPTFEEYHEFLMSNQITPLQACLGFGLSLPQLDRLIIGVNTASQLQEILTAAKDASENIDFSTLACDDEILIDPSKWPKA